VIILASTGGTLAGRSGPDGSYAAASNVPELLRALGEQSRGVRVEEVSAKLSFEMTATDWLALVTRLKQWMDEPDVDGILVTQGTALLEESPFLASLFLSRSKPLVFTGAMIPLAELGTDAIRNLLDGLCVARDRRAGQYGALVVMGRRVLSAEAVIKQHCTEPSAIVAQEGGHVGQVDGRGVDWLQAPQPLQTVFARIALRGPVPILSAGLGTEVSDWAAGLIGDARAAVVEGFPGGGGIPGALAAPLIARAAEIPVVLTSRSQAGRIGHGAGGASGGGTLLRAGLIDGGSLTAARARLVIMAAMAQEPQLDIQSLREIIARAGRARGNDDEP
jgi:L-asparaginase